MNDAEIFEVINCKGLQVGFYEKEIECYLQEKPDSYEETPNQKKEK